MKFLLDCGALTVGHLDLIWQSRAVDQDSEVVGTSVLTSIAKDLTGEHLLHLLKLIAAMPTVQVTMELVNLVRIVSEVQGYGPEVQQQAVAVLWSIIHEESPELPDAIVRKAHKLADTLLAKPELFAHREE